MTTHHWTGVRARVLLAAAALGCGGGSPPAVARSAPAPAERTPQAIAADSLFWRTFRTGSYAEIPRAMRALKAAYLQNPGDYRTAGYIGFLHAWTLGESSRISPMGPEITDNAVMARRYFDHAAARSPEADPRLTGFGAVFQMSEGSIHRDRALWADGLARGRRAIEEWPEFNWFTVGYVLSALPDTSALFREALDMQWKTMDACTRTTIDRADPRPELAIAAEAAETDSRKRRACWNSPRVPHNVEGFFLNMGDMLVKSGDWKTAQRIYDHAKVMTSYAEWPYREVLEARIRDAEQNVAVFRATPPPGQPHSGPAIMLRSPFACMACHQSGKPQ